MTELQRFTAAVLAQWQARGGTGGGPIAVADLLERVLPYRLARRELGIDVSEDYEAIMLRLIAEEEQLVRTDPVDAADMAKTTISSKLPDLDVLQLLRAATITVTPRAQVILAGEESLELTGAVAVEEAASSETPVVADAEPESTWAPPRPIPTADHQEPPPVTTTPSAADESCWSCHEALPPARNAKYCPQCGADQQQPNCAACGGAVERRWKHCPDCGAKLWAQS
jgi:predicted RNA-binding Zn-ribbon protein involved in translation (DUF1610 family)